MKPKKIVIITGATSGIGKACAMLFAENNSDVIICGRRKQRLEKLNQEISKKTKADVLHLCFDVCNPSQVKKTFSTLKGKWKNIDILVNNAGLALGLNPINKGNTADWNKMIDTNIKGVLYVSKAVIQGMIKRKSDPKNGKKSIVLS